MMVMFRDGDCARREFGFETLVGFAIVEAGDAD